MILLSFYTRYRTYILSALISGYTPESFSGMGDLIFFSAWMVLNTLIAFIFLIILIVKLKRKKEYRNKQSFIGILSLSLALLVPLVLFYLYYL